MSVLLLRLAGPMQAWGDSSRFLRRNTRKEPTKSGVIGLLASAQGRDREENIEDLVRLEFGVRTEQPGRIIRDFQTENREDVNITMPLTNRYYISDAVFLVALDANNDLLSALDQALRSPRWPLFLGRRACPASLPITLGAHEEYQDIRQALQEEPWHAEDWFKKRNALSQLDVACDARDGESFQSQDDVPLSFSMKQRRYASRSVFHFRVPNPSLSGNEEDKGEGHDNSVPASFSWPDGHDPMNF